MVEMAIVAPFLALLLAGILEYGTLWRDNLTVTSSSRAASRVVSNLGSDHLSDYEALLSLNAGLSAIDGYTLEYVMIYDASAHDGAPSAGCFSGSGDPLESRLATATSTRRPTSPPCSPSTARLVAHSSQPTAPVPTLSR